MGGLDDDDGDDGDDDERLVVNKDLSHKYLKLLCVSFSTFQQQPKVLDLYLMISYKRIDIINGALMHYTWLICKWVWDILGGD